MFERAGTSRQITSYFAVCFTLVTIALGFGASWIGSRAIEEQLDLRIENEAITLARIHGQGGTPAVKQALNRRDDRGVNTLGYLLRDAHGTRLGGELRTTPTLPGWHDIVFVDGDGVGHRGRAFTRALPDRTLLTIAAESAPTRALIRMMSFLFATGLAIVLIVGVFGSVLLGRLMARRIDAMNATARRIIGGDLAQRIAVSAHDDEFDRLAITLNEMLDRIGGLIDNLRQVSSDIAHDLRTPIVHLRQQLEIAQVSAEAGRGKEIEQAIVKVDAILSLFAAILRISEVESGALRRYFQEVDLSATVEMLGESYLPVAQDSGRVLSCEIASGIAVTGDAELLAQAVVNLIENALRHTSPKSVIRIVLELRSASEVVLAVEDDGPGIPAADRPRLLRRFVRLESARSTPGFGLGLSLVSAVAVAHGGRFSLDDNCPGIAARIHLPIQHAGTGTRLLPAPGREEEDPIG